MKTFPRITVVDLHGNARNNESEMERDNWREENSDNEKVEQGFRIAGSATPPGDLQS